MTTRPESIDAFERHAQDVSFLKHFLQVVELDATRELVVEELVQRYGSHRAGLMEILAMRQRLFDLLDGWTGTLCLDATQKGVPLLEVSSMYAACYLQANGAVSADPGPKP